MESLYHYSPIPTFVWQIQLEDFVLLYYNDAAKQITMGKIAACIGSKASEIYQDQPEIFDNLKRCSVEQCSLQQEIRYPLQTTGEDRYFSALYANAPPDSILLHIIDITEWKKTEVRLTKIKGCLLSLGSDFDQNVNQLVQLSGELLEAEYAWYSSLKDENLCPVGLWRTPIDRSALDDPARHIYREVVRQGKNQPVFFSDVTGENNGLSDPGAGEHERHAYIGLPVKWDNECVGVLCIACQYDFVPQTMDFESLGIIASALESQEKYNAAAHRLIETTGLYRMLYEENPSMYFTVDEAGTVLSVNDFGASQLGFKKSELIGKPVLSIFHEGDKKSVTEQLTKCLQNRGQVMTWEFRKIKKDGAVIWVKEVARSIETKTGEKKVLIVCEDITEQVTAKNEKIAISKKLAQTEKLAILGQMTAAIAHEINNPLDVLQTKLYLLQKKMIDNCKNYDLWEDIAKIKMQINRLDQFSKKILEFAMPHSIKLQPILIKAILMRAIESLEDHVRDGIELNTIWDEDIPLIQGDEIGLEIVFKNLILNALESIHKTGKITIAGKIFNDQMIEIKIQDTGEGLAAADLQKIFDPFFTTKEKYGGTGLGLSLCKSIIDQHGGQIKAASHPGAGTIFSIYLSMKAEISERRVYEKELGAIS